MILNLTFSENNSLKPRVVIKSKDEESEIKRPRWVQFLSLLAYRRLTNIDNGWVTLDDLSRLISYRNVKTKTIGRYLADTYIRLSPNNYRFLKSYLDITTTGPYVLMLNSECISTDIPKLTEYLSWITLYNFNKDMDPDVLYHASFAANQRHEYNTSMQLIKQFIEAVKLLENPPPEALVVGYFRLANLERIIRSKTVDIKSCIDNGIRITAKIKSSSERQRMKIYANSITADTMKITKHSLPKLLKLNEETINMINTVQNNIPYKNVILGGRYLQNFIELFYKSKIISQKDLDNIYDIASASKDFELIEIMEMAVKIMQKELKNEPIIENDLSNYESLLEKDYSNRNLIFGIGWIIRRILIRSNRLEEAYQLGQKCLLANNILHQSAVYRERLADQKNLSEMLEQQSAYNTTQVFSYLNN